MTEFQVISLHLSLSSSWTRNKYHLVVFQVFHQQFVSCNTKEIEPKNSTFIVSILGPAYQCCFCISITLTLRMGRFSMVGGIHTHKDNMLASHYHNNIILLNHLTTDILGSSLTAVHSSVWLPKACWWDLVKVETAAQAMAVLVWSFLIYWLC